MFGGRNACRDSSGPSSKALSVSSAVPQLIEVANSLTIVT